MGNRTEDIETQEHPNQFNKSSISYPYENNNRLFRHHHSHLVMANPRKTILVAGATGKQGGALIQQLISQADAAGFNIVAVTRNTASPSAQRLAANFNVMVVAGDMMDPEAIFRTVGSVWGVFSVQVNSDDEVQQGTAMVDAAVAHGVSHFVYSSSDRGGPEKSPNSPTNVKNFAAKFRIEKHLEERAAASQQGMTFTILRPVTFMDNITADLHGQGFARMWEQMGDKKLQCVATNDIGWFAANSFIHPEENRNLALTLVGDELTQKEADALFVGAVGSHMPLAFCPVASAVKFFLKDTVGDMFQWFEHEGYGGDVAECRRAYPQMTDFGAWIKENKDKWTK